ncbi:MAG: transaldolase [Mucilaginibacter polytrichastri]|nr:transaldolase [Mucilaginibacter polytrichastri]
METNKVKAIHGFGQSIWLDFIERKFVKSGGLQKLIDEDGVRGVTSNPAIFEKAISGSEQYDAQIAEVFSQGKSEEEVFYELAIRDIQDAADLFKPVYDSDGGIDGYVSLEVSPELARNTDGTISQALDLWKRVDRVNVMIKIPGTAEGLPAIRKTIAEGLNINVTLLFGLPRYEEVTEAYISGLEDRVAAGLPVDKIASVASFFLSRIDVMVDPLLDDKNPDLKGKVAVASAKKAYEIYKRVFSSERWKKLEEKGAKPQRLLWASTSSKNPDIPDTFYVEELIGPDTVDTVPTETLDAFRDHGKAENKLETGLDQATQTLVSLDNAGIDIHSITQKLEDEGIEKFIGPYQKLLKAISDKK